MIVLIGENAPYNQENVFKCLNAAKPLFNLLRRLDTPHIKMLYDIYHQNMMGDFSMENIKNNIDIIGHFHVADAPGRHEPGTGNVDYVNIIKEINKLPYDGYIGPEYRATKKDGFNAVDTEKLAEAHKNPDLHPDLVVRVTGFTAYFASLTPEFRQLVVDRFLK